MSISMFNYSNRLAMAKRHYNLSVDDFMVVDDSAMMLAKSYYHCDYITLAVNPAIFDKLKTRALGDCTVKNHIRLTADILCRRIESVEIENRRWVGSCYTVTREYLKAKLNAELQGVHVTKTREKQIQREIDLLALIDAEIVASSNKAKAVTRIRSTALYLGVMVEELIVLGQTVKCLQDDIKTDNNILLIGLEDTQLTKLKKTVTFPDKTDTFESGVKISGYEIEENVYVVPLRKETYKDILKEDRAYFDKPLELMAYAYKYF